MSTLRHFKIRKPSWWMTKAPVIHDRFGPGVIEDFHDCAKGRTANVRFERGDVRRTVAKANCKPPKE